MGNMLNYDDILKSVLGEFGTYQKRCFILLSMSTMTVPVIYFILVFQFPPTIPWCKVPHIDKIKHQFCIDNVTSNCEEFVKNLTIPKHRKNVGCGSVLTYDQCHRYDISYETMSYVTRGSIQSYFNNTKTVECDIGWEYDESYSTVTSEFDLVCGRSYLNTLVLTVNMTGMLVGSFLNGYIFDRFGRMRGYIIAYSAAILFGVAGAFSPNYIAFLTLRFFLTLFTFGIFLSCFIMVSEHVGPTKRAMVGLIYPIFFSIGYMLLAVYAYFIREWWKLQLATIAPSLVFLSYWWIIPESPRWLISKGRIEEAKKIIQLSARVNNITIPKNALDGLREQKKYETNDQTKHRAIDLLKFPNMRKKTLILFYFWCICGLVYFGISFGTSNLGGNPYLNVFIAAAVEIPAYGVSFVMMENGRIGRRWSAFCSMGFCGVSNIALSFVPACGHMVWIRTTLTMLGKFCITTSFAIIIIFSAEIFPTALRTTGVGMCSVFTRVGGIIAPQLMVLGDVWKPLPAVACGITSIVASVLVLFLPETKGENLPETFEQAEQFGKKAKAAHDVSPHERYRELTKNEEMELETVL